MEYLPLTNNGVDKILSMIGDRAYRSCDKCGKVYYLTNMFDPLCSTCRSEQTNAYAQFYQQEARKGYTYNHIEHTLSYISESRRCNSRIETIHNPANDKILYYHVYCECGREVKPENFFHSITDYVCTLFYKCECGKFPVRHC